MKYMRKTQLERSLKTTKRIRTFILILIFSILFFELGAYVEKGNNINICYERF
jgi:hypothetical protein